MTHLISYNCASLCFCKTQSVLCPNCLTLTLKESKSHLGLYFCFQCTGFGNVAPKTKGGRVFCILYGLCGIPLCLVWISELGSFFGDRAKRLSGVLIRKGIKVVRYEQGAGVERFNIAS